MSRVRPGRWPELLAPIRTRDPPRFSRARPYGQTAAMHERRERKERTNRLQRLKEKKRDKMGRV